MTFLFRLSAVMMPIAVVAAFAAAASPVPQIVIPQIEKMPKVPHPFKIRDWKQVTRDWDALAFDLDAKGQYMPLVWIDRSHINFDEDTFGLYVTIADPRCGPGVNKGEYHDALNDIPAVISATLVGIDKSNQNGRDWAGMCKAYFNRANGRDVVLQNQRFFDAWKIGGGYQIDFWQDVFSNVLFFELASLYPREHDFPEIMRTVADVFHRATAVMAVSPRGFGWSDFDFKAMRPVMNKVTPKTGQPDVAGAIAWLEYMAYVKFRDAKYLSAADTAMRALNANTQNPRYDALLPYGAYMAARMNAELGRDFNVEKIVNWCFSDDSAPWPGTKVLANKFGDYDVSGLFAVRDRDRDRAYLMETLRWANSLAPLVRYDARFAHAIGKWMLNAANAARLFYPEEVPVSNQSAPEFKSLARNVIAYEALTTKDGAIRAERDEWQSTREDGSAYVFPKVSQLSLYNSAHVGIFGAIISRTDDDKILQLDCIKTDYFHGPAYPTYLYYNPHGEEKTVRLDVGRTPVNIYDCVSRSFVQRGAVGSTRIRIQPDAAAVQVLVPASAELTRVGNKLLAGGVVVDYSASVNP
jgi:hypothetical protein